MPTKKYRKFLVVFPSGLFKLMSEYCAELGLSYDTVLARINRLPKPFHRNKENYIYISPSHPVFKKVKSK